MDFFKQYQHPEWQKKRLEVLERAGWCCDQCPEADKPLHVHHKRYIKGRKVWEYDLDDFEALCESCHEKAHETKDRINVILAWMPGSMWAGAADLLSGWSAAFLPDDPDCESSEYQAGRLAGLCQNLSTADVDALIEHAEVLRKQPRPPSGLID